MRFLLHLALVVTISNCAVWKEVVEVGGHIISKSVKKTKASFDEKNSPYYTRRVKECRRRWWGAKQCRVREMAFRKDGQPLTPEEERAFYAKNKLPQ